MAIPTGEQSVELLQAQAKFWNHKINVIYIASFKCVTELGIPDIIHKHGKPMTLQQLADALSISKAKVHGSSSRKKFPRMTQIWGIGLHQLLVSSSKTRQPIEHVIEGLEGSKNLTYIKGNMFESIPQADAIMLKWILHDWSDEKCVKILKKCKEAIPSKENGGKVIIIDMIIRNNKEDHQHTETQLFSDLLMMVLFNGKERSEKEWEKLFFDAGYRGYKIAYELGLRSLVKLYTTTKVGFYCMKRAFMACR
ncbi:trans-resveratrol di-O-methyltransferase-like [Olea europaea var. sylvestris]|uniref:trans-resveratrol di-O-methyltransferase-like n=1 Tax=Olea europaea var. sylvestris TaxID=158386 RepID=UPI000C1D6777|nr:trans-resveratrol di-O-methyltransferase-like [Olea europaea var. sylvestris]